MICRIAGLGRPTWVARRGAVGAGCGGPVGPVGPPKNSKRSRVAGQGEKPGKGFQFLQVDKYLCFFTQFNKFAGERVARRGFGAGRPRDPRMVNGR